MSKPTIRVRTDLWSDAEIPVEGDKTKWYELPKEPPLNPSIPKGKNQVLQEIFIDGEFYMEISNQADIIMCPTK